MLVISRKVGQSFFISDSIKITVLNFGNDKVSVGIDAPSDVKIIREELLDTIEANKESTKKLNDNDYKNIVSLLKNNKNI
ncbi:MAG: carbon storage regulator [Clostridiales bacterium]|jgi:carbon storage regulator|nr:carbon storage regulator [Clostridiales bacterium]